MSDPPEGTLLWRGEKNKPNPGQAGNGRAGQFKALWKKKPGKGSKKQGRGVRRKAYGPF